MRSVVVGAVMLIAAGSAMAANPTRNSLSGASDETRSQAAAYANQIQIVLRVVEERYYRPVSKSKLVEALLTGLHEAAREPFPSSMKADLARPNDARQLRQIVVEARERLGDRDELRGQAALYASLKSLPLALDPHSGFGITDRRFNQSSDPTTIGLTFESLPLIYQISSADRIPPLDGNWPKRGPARIADVLPGRAAQRAGIRPGDVLTHIDDAPVDSFETFERFLQSIDGPPRSVKLTLQRPGATEPIHRAVRLEALETESVFGVRRRRDHSWDYVLDRDLGIGYLRLGFIGEKSNKQMHDAIVGLKSAGMKALIFDLRGCPGGFVTPATDIAGMFVKSGLVATIFSKDEAKQQHTINNGSGLLEGIPTTVLIDAETRGGGELIAAVLQDHKIARTAGQRSYGKGSIQMTNYLSELGNIELRLTSGSFTRPNGKNLHRSVESLAGDDWGIRPDAELEFPMTPALAAQVKQWMHQIVLRPGDSREALPLDDPENDPLREFARRELLKFRGKP